MTGWVADRFRPFVDQAPADWELRFEVMAPTPGFLDSPRQVYVDPVEIEPRPQGFAVRGRGYRAEVDTGAATAVLRGPRATYPVDRLLRLILPLMVADGLVVHGGMLADGDRGWLCSGASGSGKSTLCRLLPEHARCDEMAAVRRLDGGWVVEALPFWEARPARARLEGVFLLEHGEQDSRLEVPAARAGRALSREVLWPVAEPGALAHRLDLVADLVSAVPVWNLRFRPSREVWSLICGSAA